MILLLFLFAALGLVLAGFGILVGLVTGLLPIVVMLLAIPLAAAIVIFWVWMLVDAIRNRGLTEGEKIGWVLAIVFLHVLGSILYFFIGHPKRKLVASQIAHVT